jgi:von Hippel-Lindau disease tumor supressor
VFVIVIEVNKMAVNDENDVIYEIDDKGQQVVVRSLNSDHCVYIRFINRVSRPVDVWWRDFEGKKRHYVRMGPRTYFNVDTFVTHPWEFTDPATNESYVINNKRVYRAPRNLAGMRHRTNWLISVSVRSLRNTTLLALAEHLGDTKKVPELGLPQHIGNDLEQLIDSIQNTPEPPPRT